MNRSLKWFHFTNDLHFGWQIIECSAHGFTFIWLCMSRPSKIGQFNLIADGEHNILWFQIAMNDIVQMAIVQRIGHLVCVSCGTIFWKATIRWVLQMFVQFSLRSQFQGQIYFTLIVKPCVQPQNVWMPTKKGIIFVKNRIWTIWNMKVFWIFFFIKKNSGINRRFTHFKRDWISISRNTCFSTRPLVNSDLNMIFIATIKCVFRSRATYTRPNFPLPNGHPSSKSSFDHS